MTVHIERNRVGPILFNRAVADDHWDVVNRKGCVMKSSINVRWRNCVFFVNVHHNWPMADWGSLHNHKGNGDMRALALFGKVDESMCEGPHGWVDTRRVPLFKVRRYRETEDYHCFYHCRATMLTVGMFSGFDEEGSRFDAITRDELPQDPPDARRRK